MNIKLLVGQCVKLVHKLQIIVSKMFTTQWLYNYGANNVSCPGALCASLVGWCLNILGCDGCVNACVPSPLYGPSIYCSHGPSPSGSWVR